MTPERWDQICAIFHKALEIPFDEREPFVRAACGEDTDLLEEVLSLALSHQEAGSFIQQPFADLSPGTVQGLAVEPEEQIQQLGPYRLLESLGRGGMGSVYRALRSDEAFEKEVAVKVLRGDLASEDLVRRFRSERQILANLEHPNIAQLLDGGSTSDGRPYLVMELVNGLPLDVYCLRQGLDLDDRLRLFRKVCGAVQLAHQNLIVHRDLKPGNILVQEDGEPKLLDFGIAKLLEEQGFQQTLVQTGTGLQPMTLAYASPEQIRGQAITTASDVYSLGVLLFQLLTGHMPYDTSGRDLQALAQAICEDSPTRPSAVRDTETSTKIPTENSTESDLPASWIRRLTGDLDAILLKALRKEPSRRYSSVEQFSWDLERYLGGLPVAVRDNAFSYRAGKFLRRHRWATTAAVAAAGVALIFFSLLLAQRRQTLQERRSAVETAQFLAGLFDSNDPDKSSGRSLTALEILDRGAEKLQQGFLDNDPHVRADLLQTVGDAYFKLGALTQARPHREKTLALRRQGGRGRGRFLGEALLRMGELEHASGRYEEAHDFLSEALPLLEDEAFTDLRTQALAELGTVEQAQGHFEKAEELLRQSLREQQLWLGENGFETAPTLTALGGLFQEKGQLESAETFYNQALDLLRKEHGETHSEVAGALQNMAQVQASLDRFDEAEEGFRRALEIQRHLYDRPHGSLATTLYNFASCLHDKGRFGEAKVLAQESLEIRREVLGRGPHPRIARSLNLLGMIESELGDLQQAEVFLLESLAMGHEIHGQEHSGMVGTMANLARILQTRGRFEEAEAYLRRSLELTEETYGGNHVRVATVLYSLGPVLRKAGKLGEAELTYRRALKILQEQLGTDHSRVATARQNLAVLLLDEGRPGEAETEFRESLRILRQQLGEQHPYVAVTLKSLATALLDLDRGEEAERLARDALDIYAHTHQPNHPWVLAARGVLGESLTAQGQFPQAEEILLGALEELQGQEASQSALDRAQERLENLYLAWGRPQTARQGS
ncbi:MAG: tetratricopeptide repeat protein [Deltaproteobacteria bacterium]|nr:tetratricopeptide repeat protein [Deltaproteobacteria bacterium]